MRGKKTWWLVAAVVAIVAAFAVVIGGFLWPRPQFEEGRAPWTLPQAADSVPR